jgi:hypothetical protein
MTPLPGSAPAAIATKPFALRAQAFASTAAASSPRAIRQHQHQQQQPTRSGATSGRRAGATASCRSQEALRDELVALSIEMNAGNGRFRAPSEYLITLAHKRR